MSKKNLAIGLRMTAPVVVVYLEFFQGGGDLEICLLFKEVVNTSVDFLKVFSLHHFHIINTFISNQHLIVFAGSTQVHVQIRRQRPAHKGRQTPVGGTGRGRSARWL